MIRVWLNSITAGWAGCNSRLVVFRFPIRGFSDIGRTVGAGKSSHVSSGSNDLLKRKGQGSNFRLSPPNFPIGKRSEGSLSALFAGHVRLSKSIIRD